MDLQALRTFVAVAREGSFAAVARTCGSDPSQISRAIASLEQELGFRLFQRTTRRMALTEAGALYLARAAAVVEELDHALDEALATSRGPSGTLRLTASVAFGQACLVPLLPKFRADFPEMRLELILSDENLDLVANRIDLAIRLAPTIAADVVCSRLFRTRYRVCAAPSYLERAGRIGRPQDIATHDCLLFTLPQFRDHWLFRGARGGTAKVPVKGWLLLSNALALRQAMLDGQGPALLPDWLIGEDIAARRCIDLFPRHEVAATSFDTAAWLLYPSRRFLPRKVRDSIDFLRRALGKAS